MSFKGNTFDSPKFQHLIPNLHVDQNGWIASNNTLFAAQVVRCVYPVSEQYSKFSRYLYYFLAVTAVLLRKNAWIAPTIMGSVMAYSGVAAVHAFALATSDHIRDYSARLDDPSNWITVDNDLRLPIVPQAWDDDGDAVLAVVGVAYLILAGMQTYSSTFRQSEAKTVLFLWSLLLLIGIISAFVQWAHVDASAFPQFRFCPSTFNDTLPISKSRFDIVNDGPWNDTTWNAFSSNSSTGNGPALCIYPCFSSSLSLRYEDEIHVLPISKIGRIGYTKFSIIINLIYTLVATSGLCSLTIFLIKVTYWNGNHEIRKKFCEFMQSRPFFARSTIFKTGRVLWSVYILFSDLYARYVSIVALVGFAAWAEWLMWYNPQTSNVENVGQWGTLVGAGLVVLAAVVAEYSPKVDAALRARIGNDANKKIFGFINSRSLFNYFKTHSRTFGSLPAYSPPKASQPQDVKNGSVDLPGDDRNSKANDLDRQQLFQIRPSSPQVFKQNVLKDCIDTPEEGS